MAEEGREFGEIAATEEARSRFTSGAASSDGGLSATSTSWEKWSCGDTKKRINRSFQPDMKRSKSDSTRDMSLRLKGPLSTAR